MTKKTFNISFDFPIENSSEIIGITAVASLHHSTPHYVIDSFHFADGKQKHSPLSLLPPIEIECIKKDKKLLWVHTESHRPSLLSVAIGKAIEKSGYFETR